MVGCVLSQLKSSELYILSCEKGHGLRPRPFSQLRMWSSSGLILYLKTKCRERESFTKAELSLAWKPPNIV